MWQALSRLWKNKAPAAPKAARTRQSTRLEVEALEGRLLPAGGIFGPATNLAPRSPALASGVQVGVTLSGPQVDLFNLLETPNMRFVDHLCRDLFHAPADHQTITTLATQLDAGQRTRLDVLRSLTTSQAYGLTVVQELFSSMLHRPYNPQTDSAIANPYLQDLTREATQPWAPNQSGAPYTGDDVARWIALTPEYYQTRGGGTVSGWFSALYADALHRAPAQAERPTNPLGPDWLTASMVFQGQEHRQLELNDFYQRFLHRPLDDAGRTYWLARYQANLPTEEILPQMLASDEYFQICQR